MHTHTRTHTPKTQLSFSDTAEILWPACILSGSFGMIPYICLFEFIALLWHKTSSVLQMKGFRVNMTLVDYG